jgi:plastocyanin
MRKLFVILLFLTPLAFGPAAARAARLTGRVDLHAAGENLRSDEVRNAVVYFKPKVPVAVRAAAQPVEIRMQQKEFTPHVVAMTTGSTVRFPNSDPILHNVFSVSGANSFDLGLYPKGPGKTVVFREPGLVRVFCNVHHDMVAYVLVLDTPYFASPAADGSFTLDGLPESDGLLVVWHERAEAWSRVLQPGAAEPVAIRLEIDKPLVPPHADKHGKPYSEANRDANRYR